MFFIGVASIGLVLFDSGCVFQWVVVVFFISTFFLYSQAAFWVFGLVALIFILLSLFGFGLFVVSFLVLSHAALFLLLA